MEQEAWFTFHWFAGGLLGRLVIIIKFHQHFVLAEVLIFLLGDWMDDLFNEVVEGLNVEHVVDQ